MRLVRGLWALRPLAIYTAIFGGRDRLKVPPPGDYDFHCFTDDPSLPGATRIELPVKGDFRRSARYVKCLPNKLLRGYETWIWMDASMTLKPGLDIQKLLELSGDLGTLKHPDRDCAYEEARICAHQKLDNIKVIWDQMDRYRVRSYPAHAGLAATGFMVRKNTEPIRQFNKAWWSEIELGSRRDQLSFNPTAHRLGVQVSYVGGLYDNPWITLGNHAR